MVLSASAPLEAHSHEFFALQALRRTTRESSLSARIVCVCNQKGGCGKTTITMSLAAGAHQRGYRTLVVDGDPQGSALTWAGNADDDEPFPATVVNLSHAGRNLPREVKKMVGNYDIVIIDCPPSVDSPVAQASLLITDLALVPLLPSPADTAAVTPFLKLAMDAMLINEGLQGLVVPNMVQRTSVSAAYLRQFDSLPMPRSTTQLMNRTAHKQACAFGTSVYDLQGDGKAQAEVDALLDEVLQLLSMPPRAEASPASPAETPE